MKSNLILLHGALGSKEQFSELKIKLNEKFNTHVLNFEGHGGVESSNDFSIDLFSNNILTYITINHLQNCNVFGYSMGGYVALKLAKENPGMLNGIITLGTKFKWDPETSEKEIKMLNPQKVEEKIPAFADTLKKIHHPLDWKILMNKTAKMIHELGNGKAMQSSDFEKINNRVLITLGSEDKMVSLEESKIIADKLPNGEIMIIDKLQHAFEVVDTSVFANIICNFFDKP